jgi:hypothetical protein
VVLGLATLLAILIVTLLAAGARVWQNRATCASIYPRKTDA